MSLPSLKRSIEHVGEVEYRIAATRDELEQALALVYREYLMRGYILPEFYKSGLRLSIQNALPGTTTFVGVHKGKVVAANTLIPDSPLGLPIDEGYKQEVDTLRKRDRKICEVGQLALDSDIFGTRFFSMFNFNKLQFMLTIFKIMVHYAKYYAKFDDLCIVTNPKFMIFKFLPMEVIGEVKYYGYDRYNVKKKAAVPKRVDLNNVEKNLQNRKGLYKMFLGSPVPEEIFKNRFQMDKESLKYFFAEKTDMLKNAKKEYQQYIKKLYHLDNTSFQRMLKV